MDMKGLQPGRIVHFVMKDGAVRPMTVVAVHNQEIGMVNGVVLLDGSNDASNQPDVLANGYGDALTGWALSVRYSETNEPATWHWPPKAA